MASPTPPDSPPKRAPAGQLEDGVILMFLTWLVIQVAPHAEGLFPGSTVFLSALPAIVVQMLVKLTRDYVLGAPLFEPLYKWLFGSGSLGSIVFLVLIVVPLSLGCVSFDAARYASLASEATSTADLSECPLHREAEDALTSGPDRALSIPALGLGGELLDHANEHGEAANVCEVASEFAAGGNFSSTQVSELNVAWDDLWRRGLIIIGGP